MSAAGVEIEGVDLSYGDNHVLKHVDLAIEPGEFFAFLGPSGCGKTTLLRLIAGFNTADRGAVRVDGRDVAGLPPWKRDVGMVFQSYALWPHMNVRHNVAFGLEERRLPRAEIDRKVAAALDLVGLSAFADRKPSQLSGGQQQRVALARTIAIEPKVLLLDEPLSNLDAKMRVQVRHELRALQRRLGITTIFVTHDQEEANAICDRIAVMDQGVIQQVGAPMELYAKPANLFVANFLGAANILRGKVVRETGGRIFEAGPGLRIPLAPDDQAPDEAALLFRPQSCGWTRVGLDDVAITGRFVREEFLGGFVRRQIEAGGTTLAIDEPFGPHRQGLKIGEDVTIWIVRSAMRWMPA